MNIINLTPHTIVLPDREIFVLGVIARCEEVTEQVGNIDGIKIVEKSYGVVKDLPEQEEGIMYIVSMMVRLALPNRYDILSPGDLVRDEDGNIVGCLNLVSN